MKAYLFSLLAGLAVGIFYNLVSLRSPAPPVIALVGLLGILTGEQIPPFLKNLRLREPLAISWLHQVQPHMFGHLPRGQQIPIPAERDVFVTGSETEG